MPEAEVSIIVLNWDKLEYTRNCISSIDKNTDSPDYEIILFDNGSTEPGTEDYFASLRHRVVRSRENLGFAKGNNRAAAAAVGKFLLFLNNDTEVHENWLAPMLETFRRTPCCGIVGSRLLYPDSTIQHVGIMFDHRGNCRHPYKKQPADTPAVLEERECEAVTGACLLIPRELFMAVGGFDERYLHGSEDVDLCLTVRSRGLKVMYCPDSVVTHYEQVSLKAKGDRFKKKTTRRNLKLFREKWGALLDSFRLTHDLTPLKPVNYYKECRSDIAALIPPEARFILDVGCSGGQMGRGLKEANAALTVWGVEVNPAAAEEAARHLDKVFLIDVEKADDPFGEARFDCIVIADVLEHLKDPWSLLGKMARYLAPGGKVICSVPNIGHYKAVKDILRDRWLYREEGLLDMDHLRFFTLSTVKHMCAVSGLSIVRLERNRKASNFMRLLNAVSLGRMEKMLTHQYLVVCERRLAP